MPPTRTLTAAFATLALAACAAAPLPDGSRILRDDTGAASRSAAPLTPDEARRLAQQNAQILAEQDAARAREAHAEAMRHAYPYAPHYYGPFYGPYWHTSVWAGSRWHRRSRWSFGLGIWGP